ncbi:MAG: amidohydrolase family protein [Acidobacteriaceae bacterium]
MNIVIDEARCALGPEEVVAASVEIAAGRITRIAHKLPSASSQASCERIDLSGFLLLPGLINAHDHLQFSLFPRLANPPYQNYIQWGKDIHAAFPKEIALHKSVSRSVRLWWGGIRNLLCGVTTVCHHDPLWPELRQSNFPVQILQQYGWAHSLALGGNLHAARAANPKGQPFIVHACEGLDDTVRRDIWQLDRLGLLDADTILVHALALDPEGAALLRKRKASVILCPSSNQFLFGKTPAIPLLSGIDNLAIGNDSPLSAIGDLLDEVRFATQVCAISPREAYRMVTTFPSAILRLNNAEGSISESGTADLIAVRDTGYSPARTLQRLSTAGVELVMIAGRVQLASNTMLHRLPASARSGLEPLSINGTTRWLRAPVSKLLAQAERVLGRGNVRLSGASVVIPQQTAVAYGR